MELKEWYKSRTVWVGLLTGVSALAKAFGILPDWMTSGVIDEIAGVLMGAATIYFRVKAEKLIAPVMAETPA